MGEDFNRAASHCPNCQAEYRVGFDACADCGIALVQGPASAPEEHFPTKDAWAQATERVWGDGPKGGEEHPEPVVLVELGWEEAWMLAGRLNDEGIEARVSPDYEANLYGKDPILSRQRFEVLVPNGELERAREVVRAIVEGRTSI